ncbi:MAG: hypothetical protein KKB91_13975 [Proteobacteria bacterium]|jgi:hypothetical protein|nr:hypothetical protein [Desulfocapsa sp.]MBU3943087.1 hypothetical protein [Pseudomonadota bacterium]MBU4042113.1 hypothetical protein [Pseudomonadota bacterium]MBU4168986.1 hypothetical protein [Pseudomonadota bacterium]MBU4234870.1 hypothetical protein [Pseudomonadota bacterium]
MKEMNRKLSLYKFLSSVKLFLLASQRKRHGEVPRAIFLHSLFRSGSTYLFKKFRETDRFWCYYEPFHHELLRLKKDNLALFRFDKEATGRMNHPGLEKPHFYEYSVAMGDDDRLPFFNTLLAYDEFASVKHQACTFKYVLNLIDSVPDNSIPFLQFNRSSLRIHWFKKYFPNSFHAYLLRAPRDQFESYCLAGKHSNNIFLAINLYIILKNYNFWFFREVYDDIKGINPLSGNIFKDLDRCINHVNSFSYALHYKIFLHLWIASLVEGSKSADVIIDMNKLGKSEAYSTDIANLFSDNFSMPINFFNDANIKCYDSFILDSEEYEKIEHQLSNLYGRILKEIDFRFQ